MFLRKIYYHLKPLIPRRLQISLRRKMIRHKLPSLKDIWPIDPGAAKPPQNWNGWPEGKKFALVLTHDVETAKGHAKVEKLMRLEMELGFRSAFNFVPERYPVSPELRSLLTQNGFEVGVHGLKHDGKLYQSKKMFQERARKINQYLKDWQAVGFRSPAMHHNLEWLLDLNIEYDASTFDTDPFEPQSDGVRTIFPFWVNGNNDRKGYVELPYTLVQDFTLFILMQKKDVEIWKQKLDWIARRGGVVLFITHPDYMDFNNEKKSQNHYPSEYYKDILCYLKDKYHDQYWHVLPNELARYWKENYRSEIMHISKYKVGDRIKVRSQEEIQQTLNPVNQLDGCLFMDQMWNYCGNESRIIKVVEHVFDEADLKMYKCLSPLYLLDSIICDGNIDSFGHRCDRSCYILWHEMWLGKTVE